MKQGNHRNGVLKARMRKAGVVPAAVNEKLDQWISGQAMKYLVP